MNTKDIKEIAGKLAEITGKEVMDGKGGFWIRGQGFVTLAKARKMTGIQAKKRQPRVYRAYGDYATMIAFSRVTIKKETE